jgi:hypothetical protein
MVTDMNERLSFLTLGPNTMIPAGMTEGCEESCCLAMRGKTGARMARRVCVRGIVVI